MHITIEKKTITKKYQKDYITEQKSNNIVHKAHPMS